MIEIGAGVDETGRLLRDEAGFLLQRDLGGTWRLVLLRGYYAGDDIVEADGVAAA